MHHCMGQELAKLEICTAIKKMVRLAPDLPLFHGVSPENLTWDEGIILRRPTPLPVRITRK
ncbi:Mycinamicin IV hydroxylase/epoxidase [Xenorhabdus beddingii]|uniref:Mycinamicin IV hydroxylase/epoxidase n=2 Tax=Xenorhabdus beddingii TaxID=40578 RepID=A0A1Y2SM42_9GAMM|nr:hypothetical protein [Xenorhabdus beddingii]OTA19029.1 Mycinamicin IV hydroxylase/epoxidase [Xenorhabdus beddingii]